MTLTDAARSELVRTGYDPRYGARPLKRAIQKKIETPLGRLLLQGAVKDGQAVTVDVGVGGELSGLAIGGVGIGAGKKIHGVALAIGGVGSERIEGFSVSLGAGAHTTHAINIAPIYFKIQGEDGEMSAHLARLLKQSGQAAPDTKPILEVNPEHALVKKLEGDPRFDDFANLLFDQAWLAEGGQLDEPAAYVQRVNRLLVG